MHRFVEEEAQRQKNIEDITSKALPYLKQDTNPDAMEDDWITNFFDKARIVSDNEMQSLWSRVLSGEANVPGTFSKRTVNFLSDLDKVDAELFSNLCRFCWVIGDYIPLIFDFQDEIYTKNGIDFDGLLHLVSIGLIQHNFLTGFLSDEYSADAVVYYFDRPLLLTMNKGENDKLQIGQCLLTKIGQELAPICEAKPIEGFWEYVKDQWRVYSPKSEDLSEDTIVSVDS